MFGLATEVMLGGDDCGWICFLVTEVKFDVRDRGRSRFEQPRSCLEAATSVAFGM